jgi:hypothetical protein
MLLSPPAALTDGAWSKNRCHLPCAYGLAVCVLVPGTQKGEVSNLHRFSGTYKVELGQDGAGTRSRGRLRHVASDFQDLIFLPQFTAIYRNLP